VGADPLPFATMSADVLEAAFAQAAGVLETVSPEQTDLPTPCTSWKVRDVVNHLVGGPRYFAVTAETGTAPAQGEMTDFARGDYRTEFAAGAARAVAAFRAEGAMDKTMTLPFGELPGSRFVLIASTDAFVHAWDLAKATGQPTDLDPELATRLLEFARVAIPDAFRGPDGKAPFGPAVSIDESAPAADRLAAFMGRQP